MPDEQPPQHDPVSAMLPAFLCSACGYVCATTWEARPPNTSDSIFYERGKILVAIARQMPLRTVCIHPDGTSSHGGAATAIRQGRVVRHMMPPDEAQERRVTSHPTPEKRLEDALLLSLAGPIAANLYCPVHPSVYPEEFAEAYDRLLDLPDTSPLLAYDDDLRLTALQHRIIDLLDAADADLSEALLTVLVQRHVLTPPVMQALMANPRQAYDDATDQC